MSFIKHALAAEACNHSLTLSNSTASCLQESTSTSDPEEGDVEDGPQRYQGQMRNMAPKQAISPEILQELEEDAQIEREEEEARRRMAEELERQEELARSSMAAVLHHMSCHILIHLSLVQPIMLVMLLS